MRQKDLRSVPSPLKMSACLLQLFKNKRYMNSSFSTLHLSPQSVKRKRWKKYCDYSRDSVWPLLLLVRTSIKTMGLAWSSSVEYKYIKTKTKIPNITLDKRCTILTVWIRTGLSKQCKPRWDAAECSVSSGSTLVATHHLAI